MSNRKQIGDQVFSGRVNSPDPHFDESEWTINIDELTMQHSGSTKWHIRLVDGVMYSKLYESTSNSWSACRQGLQNMFNEAISKAAEEILLDT